MADYHLITDLIPTIARFFFLQRTQFNLPVTQKAILLGIGLQHKTVEELEKELDLPVSQILGLFNRLVRKTVTELNGILEREVEKTMALERDVVMEPTQQSMEQELEEAAEELKAKQKKELEQLKAADLSQYTIKGQEDEWAAALKSGKPKHMVSIKSGEKKKHKMTESVIPEEGPSFKKKKKKAKLAKSAKS